MKVFTLSLGALATNCYIAASGNEAVVIDPAGECEAIVARLEQEGLLLKAILLTHAHFDHIGAVDELVSATNAPLYCPLYDAPALRDSRLNASYYFGEELTVKTLPTRLLKDGEELLFGAEKLTVMATPGHTAGGCCYLADDAVFVGDTLFYHSYGRTDLPSGDEGQLFSSLRRLLSLEGDLTVYPGHGTKTTLDNERRYSAYKTRGQYGL